MENHRLSAIGQLSGEHVDREKLVFAVGYDGSQGAHAALHMVLKYFLCKRTMAIAKVVHVYSNSKDYLPPKQRTGAIEKYLDVYDTTMGKKVTKHLIPRLDMEKSAGRYLTEFANEHQNQVDICVVGFFGRKRKDFDHGEHLMASNVNYVLQHTRCSMLVVKESFKPYSFVHWLVCVDHHKESEKAMLDALCLSETDDFLTVLHIAMRDEDTERVKETYSKVVERCTQRFDRPRKVKLVVQAETGRGPADDIMDYVTANNVNIICVGTDSGRMRRGKTYLGSCAAKVLVCSSQPVLVAHFDSDFAELIEVEPQLKKEIEPLPKTAQTASAAVEYSDLRKWRGPMAMGVSGLHSMESQML